MKKTILFIGLMVTAAGSFAQQPFEKYRYKVKIATLSDGRYNEFFDQDTLTQVGSVIINRLTGRIVSFVTYDTAYSEATLQPELISRWMSPDPLADKYYSYSPYHFSGNNPIRFIDPDGRSFIDFYDQNGNRIGTDGNDDGRVVVVTNRQEARQIRQRDSDGGTTQLAEVNSGVELPSAQVRADMGAAVDRSDAPNAGVEDTQGGFHEEGGIYGVDANGTQVTNAADAGPVANPQTDPHAEIDVWSGEQGNIAGVQGTYHVHPSGQIRVGPPANTIGPTTTYAFDQPPSGRDLNNAVANSNPNSAYHTTGNNYVLGARSGTVYIYNQTGQVASFPLRQFRSIGNR